MNLPVTTFRGLVFTRPNEQTTLEKILIDIKAGKWKTSVIKCYDDITKKDWLPVFTPTGTFNHRSIRGLEEYNGIICLDIDNVEDPKTLKHATSKIPWIHASFTTPSGKGVKVLVRTNSTVKDYKTTESKVAKMFLDETGFARDERAKDISRIQFVSYDPELFYNPTSDVVITDI